MEQLKKRDSKENNVESINDALKTLNEASVESTEEIQNMLNRDYKQLKRIFSDIKPNVKKAFGEIKDATSDSVTEAREQVVSTTKDSVNRVDQSARQNPWAYVGGAAAVSALVGYFLGRKPKD